MSKPKLTGGKKFKEAMKELNKISKQPSKVKVGLPKDAMPYPDGTSVIMVASVNEFGSIDGVIPERSFLRSGVNKNKREFKKFWKKEAGGILTGNTPSKKVLGLLGQFAQSKIQEQIVTVSSPANAASTIAMKGSSNPLLDSGHLRQTIRYQIGDL